MLPNELLRHAVGCLERGGIPYFITGAVAGIVYGEPRLTNDIDIVADIREEQLPLLKRCFPEEDFYLDLDTALKAVRARSQFNIIHPSSGFKIDFMIPDQGPFDRSRFERRRRIKSDPEFEASFASPEDVILKKMEFYREGRSDKHIRDILGILNVSGESIDPDYLAGWAENLGLKEIWTKIRERWKK
jgi:hypothetical protein